MKYDGGAQFVKHYVGFGAIYKGTTLWGVNNLVTRIPLVNSIVRSICASCTDLLTPSEFNTALSAGGITVPGPDYTTIATRTDEVVVPPSSGIIEEEGVSNVWLQDKCPVDLTGHALLAVDPNVLQIMRWAFAGKQGPMPQGCSTSGAYP